MILTNTRAVLWKCLLDFKRGVYTVGIIMNLFYVLSVLYSTVSGSGFVYLNISLLVLSVAYFVFYIIAARPDVKASKKGIARINRYIKIAVHTLTLGVSVYALYTATEKPEFLSALFASLSVIAWIFQVVSAVMIRFFEVRINLLTLAFNEDTKRIRKPFNAVGTVVSRIKGEEASEPKPEPSEQAKGKIKEWRERFIKYKNGRPRKNKYVVKKRNPQESEERELINK